MLGALGPERYSLFFKHFSDAFFSDDDAEYLASLGLNSVRIPFNYRHFEDDGDPFVLKAEGFRLLDRAVEICARNGLYAVLDLHAVPGAQNQHWHSDNPTHRALFWTHRQFQDRVVHLWEALAERYKDEAAVAGYNILNEPGEPSGKALKPFYDRVVAAVRAIDARHIIFLDGNRYATDFSAFEGFEVYPNTVYAAHDYKLPGFADGGPYPGVSRGVYVDRTQVEDSFLQRTEFMRKTGTPIWIAEFGPLFPPNLPTLEDRFQLLQDQLEIYNAHGASWSLWAYKDIGGQGLVSAAPDSPWLARLRPMIEKKARLGVDGWGSTDAGIRDVMAPIEALFLREYPNFNPYPFGKADWIATLVRSIMLAEPMLDDFEQLLSDVPDDATVTALANSFKFSNCVRRVRLAELVGRAARAPVI